MKEFPLVVAAMMLPLAACTYTSGPTVATQTVAVAPAHATAVEQAEPISGRSETSARGNLVKELGRAAGIGNPDGEVAVTFTLTDVVPDPQCTADPMRVRPPANGHYVAFEWEVETGSAAAMTEAFYDPSFTLFQWDMNVLDENGKPLTDLSGSAPWCLETADALPTAVGPEQTASGLIVLDLEATSGTLVLNGHPWGVERGWEWAF